VELQGRYDELREQGLGLAAISYDPPGTLKAFADSRKITFPLLSDTGSATIKRYGIFNMEQQDPQARTYGIPHPGTFIVDRKGIVRARYFEEAYQERYTTATILTAQGAGLEGVAVTVQTAHLTIRASIPDASAAPGERLSLVLDVTPRPSMHVYAPGKHTYRVVDVAIDGQPWLRAHATTYPPAEIYHFRPLDERVEVYSKPFRLTKDLTILATPEMQKALSSMPSVTVTGALDYQACDDKLCFNPARAPFVLTVSMRPLDRQPAAR
jgi:hypothetical protein